MHAALMGSWLALSQQSVRILQTCQALSSSLTIENTPEVIRGSEVASYPGIPSQLFLQPWRNNRVKKKL